MTQLASTDSVVGDFEGAHLERFGREYRLGRDAESFWIDFEDGDLGLEETGAQANRRNIALCTGSHHMQVYWTPTGRGRELSVLPFAWLIHEQKWIPRESAFLELPSAADEYEPGRWNRSCIACHTTHGDRRVNPPPPQSTVAEFGIACEACHGPGENHIRYHRSRAAIPEVDPIVHPFKLSHVRAAEVCGQCHMAWHGEVAGSGLDFRPGDDLQSLRRVDKKPSQFWPDGMVRVVGREFNGLIESPCFERGELSCITCHVMHQTPDDPRSRTEWADDQLQPGMRGNQACVSCHGEFRDEARLTAHTHHAPSSQGSLCYNCHMPNTSYGLLKATRSHQISSPSVAETASTGRPNACNLCHLEQTLDWTGEKLAEWFGQAKPAEETNSVAMSVRMALSGDAAQRALIAWHMGWESAREASGDDWIAPYLAILMTDDYPAVRFIAHRSLKQIGGYGHISYDSEEAPMDRDEAASQITARWDTQRAVVERPSLLITEQGRLEIERVAELLRQRDQTVISLEE
jgi:hypothetical protein